MENFDHYLPKLEALVKSGGTDNIDLAIEIASSMGLYDKLLAPWREIWSYLVLSENSERNLLLEYTNIKDFNFSVNGLVEIPYAISMMQHLEELTICDTKIKEIPTYLTGLPNLKKLNLNNNYIKSVPAEILQMPSLNFIDLNNNSLKNLPELGPNINVLYIAKNSFKKTPDAILAKNNLEALDISKNSGFCWDLKAIDFKNMHYLRFYRTKINYGPLSNFSNITFIHDEKYNSKSLFGNVDYYTFDEVKWSNGLRHYNFCKYDYHHEMFFEYPGIGGEFIDYELYDYLEDQSYKFKGRFRFKNRLISNTEVIDYSSNW